MKVGQLAPDFTLPDQNGKKFTLSKNNGRLGTVLFFYPRDHTQLCTEEACAFRDRYEVFQEMGAQVVGVSGDALKSHKQFAKDYKLPFPILSDEDGKVRRLYKATTLGVIPARVTYVLDPFRIIAGIYKDMMHGEPHVAHAMRFLGTLEEQL